MLSMQQTILNRVSGTEQPQEEVHLTELLPVKQSRIRENDIFKDADTTDALKVLRSFTGNCNEDQDFQLQDFNFPEKIDRQDKQGTNKQQRGANQRRKVGKCKNISKGPSTVGKGTINGQRSDNETIKKKTQGIGKKNISRATTAKRKLSKSVKKKDGNETKVVAMSQNMNEKDILENGDEIGSEYENEEETTYLDLDRNKDFNDEVYVFRRETLDVCSTPDPERERDTSIENRDIYKNNYLTTDGTLFEATVPARVSDTNINEPIDNKENETNYKTDPKKKPTLETSEKELSLNIDAIIQANYLLERENNNVMQLNQNNKVPDSSSTSATPLSNITEGYGSGPTANNGKNSRKENANSQEHKPDGEQKKYCCVVCDARFKGSGGLRNHYKIVHGAGPIFKCDECGKEFPLKERLKLHVRTHTGFKPYKCSECDKSFARGGQLVQHRRTHTQVKPYRCALCSGTFTCAANLALHVKRHNGQKDHKCEICGRAFVRRDALKKHLECLHRDVKSFLCVICNKTFKGHLPQHMRTHARDRPHGCATCGQRFAQKSQLTVHQRTHSGQRPFRCLVCWQAFAHSTALKLHTRRHTGERPFKCAECNAGFTQLPHWKKHMKCIHGRNEPYGCKRCKSFFRIKNDLECHEKICHPHVGEGAVDGVSSSEVTPNEVTEKGSTTSKYRVMTVERMRLLLAVLLKRISKQERLDELGFGKRLIDEVLQDSLISAGKDPATGDGLSELETLTKNLEIFLKWTVPKEHWEHFRRLNKTPEDILETLTAT